MTHRQQIRTSSDPGAGAGAAVEAEEMVDGGQESFAAAAPAATAASAAAVAAQVVVELPRRPVQVETVGQAAEHAAAAVAATAAAAIAWKREVSHLRARKFRFKTNPTVKIIRYFLILF